MPRRYVLDESIVKGAPERNGACGEAIVAIVRRCDSLVFNEQWMKKCYAPVKRSSHSLGALALLRILDNCFAFRGKLCQEAQTPPALEDESGIHHKDLWLVRLAVASGAQVVTEDGDLAESLRRKGISCSDARAAIDA